MLPSAEQAMDEPSVPPLARLLGVQVVPAFVEM
jgi:hypothetical protein